MKKTLFYISLAVLAMSCVKEQTPGAQDTQKNLVSMEFNAFTEDVTKTSLAADGASVEWIEGDEVLVFDGSNVDETTDKGVKFTAQSSGSSVVISGAADPVAAEYYAIYPSASGKMSLENIFTSKIGSQQIVTAGTMADDCAVMIAKASDKNMQFKNVTALVEFTLQEEGVRSLTLIGNNNEKITGAFTAVWNDGEPVATPGVAEVTATLRYRNNADLATGKYYFTILPTNFTKGFSIILGMNDGTQKIVKRTAAADIKRNQIFCTQEVPAAAIKAHASNFVKFNDGFDLTYAHLTINKEKVGKYATYVNDGKGSISSAGVYFVGPESTNVNLAVLGTTALVVAGDNPDMRSVVVPSKAIQPQQDKNGYVVLADLTLAPAEVLSQFILQQTEEKGGFENFGSIIVSDCKVNAVTSHFIACNNRQMTLDNLVIENSDILLNVTATGNTVGAYIFNTGSKKSTVNNVTYHNNVFHNIAEASTVNRFRLVNGENNSVGLTLGDVTVTNNTLVGALLNQHGYVRCQNMNGHVIMQDNFFVESHPASTNIQLLYAVAFGEEMTCEVKNNFYYTTGMTKSMQCNNVPAKEGLTRTAINPVAFTFYPLSAEWNPANDIFGYASDLKYGSLATSGVVTEKGDVAAYRGAQRKTSSATLNKAGQGYGEKDLGNI